MSISPFRAFADAIAGGSGRHGDLVRPPAPWQVRCWALWSLPRPAPLYVLAVDAAALAAVAVSVSSPVTWGDAQIAGLIGAAMLAHLYLSRMDERLHSTRLRSPHIDLGWIWLFPSAVLLPPVLALGLVLFYAQRWWLLGSWDARPLYRTLFNTSVWVLAAAAASALVGASGRRERLGVDPGGWADLATMLLAAATSLVVNLGLIVGVLAIATGARGRDLFAGAADNMLELSTLLLGICVALAVAWWPPFVLLMVLPAVVLHRTVRIQHLEVVARTDDKTGVLNSLAFHQQARAELVRTRRAAGSMAIFMIDLDGFKQINDEHGHLAGDAVLRRVAGVLAGEVRRSDAVGRVGGDEFAILLPAIDVAEALTVAERVRAQVRQVPTQVAGGLSVSIGVAVHPHLDVETVEGMLAAADAAMYEAKRTGRDRICLARRARSAPLLATANVDSTVATGS